LTTLWAHYYRLASIISFELVSKSGGIGISLQGHGPKIYKNNADKKGFIPS